MRDLSSRSHKETGVLCRVFILHNEVNLKTLQIIIAGNLSQMSPNSLGIVHNQPPVLLLGTDWLVQTDSMFIFQT